MVYLNQNIDGSRSRPEEQWLRRIQANEAVHAFYEMKDLNDIEFDLDVTDMYVSQTRVQLAELDSDSFSWHF